MRIPFLALDNFFDFLQLVVPEELHATVVQEHIQSYVLWGSPSALDRAHLPSQFGLSERCTYPHPQADERFF
jgi:hypothetical protein